MPVWRLHKENKDKQVLHVKIPSSPEEAKNPVFAYGKADFEGYWPVHLLGTPFYVGDELHFHYYISDIDLQTTATLGKGVGEPSAKAGKGNIASETAGFLESATRKFSEIRMSVTRRNNYLNSSIRSIASETSGDITTDSISSPSSSFMRNSLSGLVEAASKAEIEEVKQMPIQHGPAIHASQDLLDKGVAGPPKEAETFRAFFLGEDKDLYVIDIPDEDTLRRVCAMFYLFGDNCYVKGKR